MADISRRADAEINRARIVDAARAALTEDADVTMNSIARAAGVGQGTLYRHFPTRDALLVEVYRRDVQAVMDAARPLSAKYPPGEALRRWLDKLAPYGRVKRGVAAAVEAAASAELAATFGGPMRATITELLDAAKASGDVRDDVDADQVLLLVGFLWRGASRAQAARLLDVVVAGLRPDGSP